MSMGNGGFANQFLNPDGESDDRQDESAPCPLCGMPGTGGALCETCYAWEKCGAEKYEQDEPVDLVDFVNRNLRQTMWGDR